MIRRNKVTPYPHLFYWLINAFFLSAGLLISVYLAYIHYKNYADIAFASICAISKSLNCDTVAQSPYAIVFSLPVAHWGIFAFIFLGWLSFRARLQQNQPIWLFFFLSTCLISVTTLYFAYLSSVAIKSYCIFCLIVYTCFYFATFTAFIVLRRFEIKFSVSNILLSLKLLFTPKKNLIFPALFLTSMLVTPQVMPHYWELDFASTNPKIHKGITEDGHPWIGAENPQITVNEYTDYQCFQCYKTHFYLRRLLEQYPETLRIVHHHFPLDAQYNPLLQGKRMHIGAGKMALLAIQATRMGNFWEVNDELYRIARGTKKLDTFDLADKVGLNRQLLTAGLEDPDTLLYLKRDFHVAFNSEISSTPSFIIDGKTYSGMLPPEFFQRLKEAAKAAQ